MLLNVVCEHLEKESSPGLNIASSRTGLASNITGTVSRFIGLEKAVHISYLNFRKVIKIPIDFLFIRMVK